MFSSLFYSANKNLKKEIENTLSLKVVNLKLYEIALSHRSIKEGLVDNNERLEYLGDAVLSSIVADYLFKRYATKGEGFLTEMRSKMVNRQQLNDIAIKMGFKQLMNYNKSDNILRNSQIFGNTLEAVIGAIYLDKGYIKTQKWVLKQIVMPHMFVESLEGIDINLKNKLIGWATKNGKNLLYDVAEEKREGTRRIFTINVVVDGEI
ncbi:MAG: ribonuclease III, partial [Bacteroidetes bacterium]|nr:ribonuclease III [Bacteroidota bacterium]